MGVPQAWLVDSSYLRQIAGKDGFAQRVDRLRPRIAPAPRDRDAAARNRTGERPDANQLARFRARGHRSRRQHGHAYPARDHLPDRLERAALQRAPDRAASRAADRAAELQYLVAQAMPFSEQQQALALQLL